MYALSASAEGDCYRCVPPDPGKEAVALGASESSLPGTAPAEVLHTFTLDSGASRCFFHDSTTLTPLPAPVPVRLADPSRGPVVARSSTVFPCPAVQSGSLSGLHLPSFSTNLVSTATLQDSMVTTTTPGGSSLYTLATEPPQVAASAQVSASGQVAPPCLCRLLSHQTLLCHHRLGHPSLPRLRGMHSRLLVSGLPKSLPPLPPSPAPPCLPCAEGRQRASPHSSSFPPMTAPLQTLHMDVWGPARVSGQVHERYFLLVFDNYTRYTTLREWFSTDLPVLHLHSNRGGTTAVGLGGARTRGTRAARTGGVGGTGAGDPTEPRAAGAGGTGAGGTGAGGAGAEGAGVRGTGVGGTGAGGAGAGGTGAGGARDGGAGAVLGVPSSPSLTPPLLCPPPDQTQLPLQPASPLLAPSPYTEQSGGLTERHQPVSRLSSLPVVPDPEFDLARAASPTVSRLLASVIPDPSFESSAVSAPVAELVDFAAACCQDYATALVAEYESASPPSVVGECPLGTDVLEDWQEDSECLAVAVPRFASMLLAPEGDPDEPDILAPRSYAEAITGPYSSQWQAAMDA
ncbi:unnamed protein product [Closterium sp. NIES-53]